MLDKLREMITLYLQSKQLTITSFSRMCNIKQQVVWRFLNTSKGLHVTTYEKIISFLKSNSAGIEYPEELKELIA